MTPGSRDVSVIIPYFNRERYIDEAVQSVLAQTLQPLEIIVVNDCSSESSRRFLDRYANACTIIDLPANVGLAGSRNAGIRAASGEFIALLDDDDIWLPHKLELQRRFLAEHPECSGVHSAVYAMFPNKPDTLYRRFGTWWRPASEAGKWMAEGESWAGPLTLAQALTNDHWVIPSTMMFRTEVVRALGGFDPKFRQCEDRDLIIRFCAAGYQIQGIYEPLTRLRRQGQSSLTSRPWRIFRGDMKTCWKHRNLFIEVYGFRGIVWFVLEKLQEPTFGIRFVYGGVRRLLNLVKTRCKIKPNYQEPVGNQRPPVPAQRKSVDKGTLVGEHQL